MARVPKEGTAWGRVEYTNPETGGKVMVEQDRKRIYFCITDWEKGYVADASVKKITYDPVTPVLLGIAVALFLARVALLLIPA